MKKLIISGSPRRRGKSMHLTQALSEAWRCEDDECDVSIFSVADHSVSPCIACDGCKKDAHCIIDDAMQSLYPLLEEADHLTVVSPVYFAGPPAQMKAVLDRMQPFFWSMLKGGSPDKRPADLFVIGEGEDPHGFEPLIGSTRSALALAGFSLERVYDCVGLDFDNLDVVACHPSSRIYREKCNPFQGHVDRDPDGDIKVEQRKDDDDGTRG